MDILHERVAVLEVHKESVVSCVRCASGGRRTFATTTKGADRIADVAGGQRVHARRNGGYGRLLDAGMEDPPAATSS